jgi:hypothetical protein
VVAGLTSIRALSYLSQPPSRYRLPHPLLNRRPSSFQHMTKRATIPRTGCFAWHSSPSHTLPLLATGTAAGALDESFSSEGKLEVWEVFPGEKKKVEKELGGDDGMKKEEGGEGEQEEDDDFLKPEGRRGDEREPIVSYKVGSRYVHSV